MTNDVMTKKQLVEQEFKITIPKAKTKYIYFHKCHNTY